LIKENEMPAYCPVTESLVELMDWMHKNAPGVAFSPPADTAALANFEEKSGLIIPEDLHRLLMIADGETRNSAGAVGNWRFMSINEIQAAWGWLAQISVKGAFDGLTPQLSPYLQNHWWHPGWIPLISSDTGCYYCLDTAPSEVERTGQMLLFCQEHPARPLVAASLAAWLDRITRDLSAGVYTYNEVEGFNGEAFLWSSLEGKHLLDKIPGQIIVDGEYGIC